MLSKMDLSLELNVEKPLAISITINILKINWACRHFVEKDFLHMRDLLINGRESRVGLRHFCLALNKR